MAKLYSPTIESTIPACYDENGMVKLTIPFFMNTAVSASQIGGFELKIKTVQTGSSLYVIQTTNPADYEINDTESYVIFYLNNDAEKIKVGQFYKVQLAYIGADPTGLASQYSKYINGTISLETYSNWILSNGVVGHYSSTGAIKYTTKPEIYINDFKATELNPHTYEYIGYYSQEGGDLTERIYSYQFNIYDSMGEQVVFSSGECVHNNADSKEKDYLSLDKYYLSSDLKYNTIYYIDYTITTINKLTLSSPKYRIIQRKTIDPEIEADLIVSQNFNNGYLNISLSAHRNRYMQTVFDIIESLLVNKYTWLNRTNTIKEKGFTTEQANIILSLKDKIIELSTVSSNLNIQHQRESEKKELIETLSEVKNCTGSFILSRSDNDSNYSSWEEIFRFKLFEEVPTKQIYKDFTVAQGKKYQYSIQQYNDYGLYSNRVYSDIIVADFEDSFLYDGQRQLRIRYNPKVSKFANTVLEQKQETIGSKYPFIFRNGNINYHEFSISGLISYLSDEEFLFMSEEELNLAKAYHRHETFANKDVLDLRDSLSENITRERYFKTKVLEWLNNGKPKVFRSATEGNFLVRLMKNSLSPEDKLGRMLHTFSSTAYEIAEFTSDNLKKYNFIAKDSEELILQKYFTKKLTGLAPGTVLNILDGNIIKINSLKCEDMFFGDELIITYENGEQESIKIGITGAYEAHQLLPVKQIMVSSRYRTIIIDSEDTFTKKKKSLYKYTNGTYQKLKTADTFKTNMVYYILSNPSLTGNITFGYSAAQRNEFSKIKNAQYINPTYRQFIGAKNLINEINKFNSQADKKKQFMDWYYIKVEPRPIDRVIRSGDQDNTMYFYGQDIYSEKLQFSEIKYPIGLKVYEPGLYYKNVGDTSTTTEEYNLEHMNYYRYGKYVLMNMPIGNSVYRPGVYYVNSNGEYSLSNRDFNKETVYYSQYKDEYDIIHYKIVKNLTDSDDHLFQTGKFYRKTENGKFTLSNSFVDEYTLASTGNKWEKTTEYYYEFQEMSPKSSGTLQKDGTKEGYHNAYVTISDKYLYQPGEYHMQVTLGKQKTYVECNSGDFNVHGLTSDSYPDGTSYIVEYEPYSQEVLKYYKVKPILPHYIHQIGESWKKAYDSNGPISGGTSGGGSGSNPSAGGQIVPGEIYNYEFVPVTHKIIKLTSKTYKANTYYIKEPITRKYIIDDSSSFNSDQVYYELDDRHYIDFYNNITYKEYEPWIEIDGHRIYVDTTLLFNKDNLIDLDKITTFTTGNGVIVEVGYQLINIDYLIEDTTLASTRNDYNTKLNTLNEKYQILSNPEDVNYIDLSATPSAEQLTLYNQYINKSFQANVDTAYRTLINKLASNLK